MSKDPHLEAFEREWAPGGHDPDEPDYSWLRTAVVCVSGGIALAILLVAVAS